MLEDYFKNNKHIFTGVLVNINIVHLLTAPQAYQYKINYVFYVHYLKSI